MQILKRSHTYPRYHVMDSRMSQHVFQNIIGPLSLPVGLRMNIICYLVPVRLQISKRKLACKARIPVPGSII